MALKQQIKIGRRPWIIAGILVVAVVLIGTAVSSGRLEITTVYIVRHAEKADNSANPPLSAVGQARAEELAHVLGDEGIDAVFVTKFTRTQQTGAPVAARAGVTPERYSGTQSVVDAILADHIGDRVLVVGHSNTVDDIAAGLGAAGLSDLTDEQYDRLFVVHRFGTVAHLDRLRYGAETP